MIGTTASYGAMREIGLAESFELHVQIPYLELDQARSYIMKFCEVITSHSGVLLQLEPNNYMSRTLEAMARDGRPICLKPIILALNVANGVCKVERQPLTWDAVDRSLERIFNHGQ